MRSLNFVGVLLCTFTISTVALAKSDKYKRNATPAPSPSAQDQSSGASKSSTDLSPTANPSPAPSSDKVDITDLENRYWTAKDTEFKVVQNRLYTKANRFSLTPQFGWLMNDPYTNTFNFGLAVNYYFSERQGVEIQGWKGSSSDSDFIPAFATQYGAIPNYNYQRGYIGASYNWIPIYAKLSLLEKRIMYFDMAISPGIGITYLESRTFARPNGTNITAPSSTTQNPITFALDLSQQFFIDKHWALRADLRNHFFSETTYDAGLGTATRTKTQYYGNIMVGVTFFQ